MILDLNGFKSVNDQLGHGAGDRLLTIMAGRLAKRLRETDTIARLGGDEFALLIEKLAKPEHAALVARKLLDTVAPPVELDDRQVSVTASLGVALYPKDGDDPAELVRQADRAMYRAKAEGGNLFRFSSDQIERRVQRGALLETDLRRQPWRAGSTLPAASDAESRCARHLRDASLEPSPTGADRSGTLPAARRGQRSA
jgi:diguanylate cyclase (GGDEF)-like protein